MEAMALELNRDSLDWVRFKYSCNKGIGENQWYLTTGLESVLFKSISAELLKLCSIRILGPWRHKGNLEG